MPVRGLSVDCVDLLDAVPFLSCVVVAILAPINPRPVETTWSLPELLRTNLAKNADKSTANGEGGPKPGFSISAVQIYI